jgi:hypothetical protein
VTDQLDLVDSFLCDFCEAPGDAPTGALPGGWELYSRGMLKLGAGGGKKRRCESFELHRCGDCQREGRTVPYTGFERKADVR